MKTLIVNSLYWLKNIRGRYLVRVIETIVPFTSKYFKKLESNYYKWFKKNIDYILDWRNGFSTSFSHSRPHWVSYYDMTIGTRIYGSDQIKKWEKQGYAYARPEEFERIADKANADKAKKQAERVKKKVAIAYQKVKNDTYFTREQKAMIRKYQGEKRA